MLPSQCVCGGSSTSGSVTLALHLCYGSNSRKLHLLATQYVLITVQCMLCCVIHAATTHSGFQRNYIMQRRGRVVAAVYDDADGRGIIHEVLLHTLCLVLESIHMHALHC
jgi:hypothetical protein